MPNKKKSKKPEVKARQSRRTHANKVKKYQKFIRENPDNKDVPIWTKLMEFSKNKS